MRKLMLGLSILSAALAGAASAQTAPEVPQEPVDLPDLVCVYDRETKQLLYCYEE